MFWNDTILSFLGGRFRRFGYYLSLVHHLNRQDYLNISKRNGITIYMSDCFELFISSISFISFQMVFKNMVVVFWYLFNIFVLWLVYLCHRFNLMNVDVSLVRPYNKWESMLWKDLLHLLLLFFK